MKKNFINQTHIEGYLYEHTLETKVTGDTSKNPGTTYITGTVSIATDEEMTNIVPIHYTYVTAVTSTGKNNPSFQTLSNIVNGTLKSVMGDGKEVAAKLRVDSAIGLNEFYSKSAFLIFLQECRFCCKFWIKSRWKLGKKYEKRFLRQHPLLTNPA